MMFLVEWTALNQTAVDGGSMPLVLNQLELPERPKEKSNYQARGSHVVIIKFTLFCCVGTIIRRWLKCKLWKEMCNVFCRVRCAGHGCTK